MECSDGATSSNWTETAEDFVHGGEPDKAISFLESIVSNLEQQNSSDHDDQLCAVLMDLCNLYSAQDLSLKADQTRSRALQILNRKGNVHDVKDSTAGERSESCASHNKASTADATSDDDWEALVDREPDALLSQQCLPGVSKLSIKDSEVQGVTRRGRGPFKKHGLYSDNQSDIPIIDDSEDSMTIPTENMEKRNSTLEYGTRHVLVLADFPTSTRTTDLEKVLEKFKDSFVIRWVNDTVALAVFKTPSAALQAIKVLQFPYTARILDEDDELINVVPRKDLEPPRARPQTSTRTAQRMIALGMGIKLPLTFGSRELRKQEEARRTRIVTRQNMKDDAWGDAED